MRRRLPDAGHPECGRRCGATRIHFGPTRLDRVQIRRVRRHVAVGGARVVERVASFGRFVRAPATMARWLEDFMPRSGEPPGTVAGPSPASPRGSNQLSGPRPLDFRPRPRWGRTPLGRVPSPPALASAASHTPADLGAPPGARGAARGRRLGLRTSCVVVPTPSPTPLDPHGVGGSANSVRLRGQFPETWLFPRKKIFGGI